MCWTAERDVDSIQWEITLMQSGNRISWMFFFFFFTHLRHPATACWTWVRWAPCRHNGEPSPFPPRGRRRRTEGASRRTAGRTAAWCLQQSAWRKKTGQAFKTRRIWKMTRLVSLNIKTYSVLTQLQHRGGLRVRCLFGAFQSQPQRLKIVSFIWVYSRCQKLPWT